MGDRYELGPVVGRGGSSTVFEAYDRDGDRSVAVKMFAAGVDGSGVYRQDQEIATLARLSHPGLVALFDAGRDRGRSYLVIALVRGPSLDEQMRGGALPAGRVVMLGAQLGEALSYVHGRGVTHRDLKPANVLLDGDRPLLADFGIALLVDETRVTAVDALIGTAAYMAPEQLRGDPIGPPADVYALGLVLIEAVSGQRAFPGTSAEAVVGRLHHGPAIPPGLPAGLASLLSAMTDDRPARRPAAAGVATALEALGGGTDGPDTAPGVVAPDVTAPSVMTAHARRRSRLIAAGVAGTALVGGLVGALMIGGVATPAGGVAGPPLAAAAVPPPAMIRAPAVAVAPTVPAPRTAEADSAPSGAGVTSPSGRSTSVSTPTGAATGAPPMRAPDPSAPRTAPPARTAGAAAPEQDSGGNGRADDRGERGRRSAGGDPGASGPRDGDDARGDAGRGSAGQDGGDRGRDGEDTRDRNGGDEGDRGDDGNDGRGDKAGGDGAGGDRGSGESGRGGSDGDTGGSGGDGDSGGSGGGRGR
ncbi:serine/threonine protein kinase [Pseudonocardia sediminis]|uniref:serine/threonine protein kinase n=1 Tax=Pseudonocardia sediminis TaxID=1397368 RepID=UPI0013EEFFE5|nr:serine/threonine protein kinase [Pseudonocardia sediminis]